MPVFDGSMATSFAPYLDPSQPEALQIVAICIVDDAIEFGGAGAHRYIPQVVPIFLRNLSSQNVVLRQCSAYGIAQVIRLAPEFIASQLGTVIQSLLAIVNAADAGDEDNEGATENGYFALGSIISNSVLCASSAPAAGTNWGSHTPAQLGAVWLKGLPFKCDGINNVTP